ncbi:MAG: hypothetical protein FJW53_06775 [Actinobacteria bacterium]|nr:hypothetical protein [Actinomycetota bacterium]
METLLGVWCTATSLAFIWPQVWRTVRHDTTHGISSFATAHGMVSSCLWFSYGIGSGSVPMWFSNAQFIIAQSIIMSVLLRHGRIPPRVLARFATVVVVLVAALLPLPLAAFGWTATVVSTTSLMPQVAHVARVENLHAISLLSWAVTILSATSWMIYGWVIDDPIMSVVNYFNIPMMVFIIVRAARWRTANGVPLIGRTPPVPAGE